MGEHHWQEVQIHSEDSDQPQRKKLCLTFLRRNLYIDYSSVTTSAALYCHLYCLSWQLTNLFKARRPGVIHISFTAKPRSSPREWTTSGSRRSDAPASVSDHAVLLLKPRRCFLAGPQAPRAAPPAPTTLQSYHPKHTPHGTVTALLRTQ